MYYLVKYKNAYNIKNEDNQIGYYWSKSINELFNQQPDFSVESASTIDDNEILFTFDTLNNIEINHPELLI